jgi:hypothetical protein
MVSLHWDKLRGTNRHCCITEVEIVSGSSEFPTHGGKCVIDDRKCLGWLFHGFCAMKSKLCCELLALNESEIAEVRGKIPSSRSSQKHGNMGHALLDSESWWRFIIPQEDEQLTFFLEERRTFSANVILARCSVPSNWLAVDRISRD